MAVDESNTRHRPGIFKQQNKSHKHGRHRSNRAIEVAKKGKVNVKTLSKKTTHELRKQERRNQALQIRKKKREEVLAKKRSLGGDSVPPFLVAVIALSNTEDPLSFLELVKACDDDAIVTYSSRGNCHISLARFKQRFTFVPLRPGDLYATLDVAKVADTIILLHPIEGTNSDVGEMVLSSLFAQGLPTVVHVVQGLDAVPVKKRNEVKKGIVKSMEQKYKFSDEKLYSVDKPSDALQLFRHIGNQKQRRITFRERRSHIMAETVEFELNDDGDVGTLKVSGYVRSKPVNVNGLVHIPGWSSFQILQIDAVPDPHPLKLNVKKNKKDTSTQEMCTMEEDIKILAKADPSKQESLQSENEPDPMEGEQTWPTAEEIEAAEAELKKKHCVIRKVPKGTSDYQAAWILDEDNEETSDQKSESEDEEEGDNEQAADLLPMDEDSEDKSGSDEEEEEYDTVTVTEDGTEKYDEKMDMDEEKAMLEKFREERMEQMFPDEVDTPISIPARTRFARYRGLKSFQHSYWDPKENLPYDYARIFQFENFNRTRKRILNEEQDGAMPGWYVTVHISNVPKDLFDKLEPSHPLVVFGMLPHEQKMSVLNMVIRKNPSTSFPIKSKEELIFHVGYRRFKARPIFSTHTNGSKFKYERFLPSGVAVVATVFAPIIFPPVPVAVYRQFSDGSQDLVATGSVFSVDPDRIIVKRVVLSGHHFKINVKSAVVRYMFFNREDIMWFKPVELHTKYGRRGHIKEPLGTHGHMKCIFSGPLKSQDTVLMNLYKRVFPKWTYNPRVEKPPVVQEPADMQ